MRSPLSLPLPWWTPLAAFAAAAVLVTAVSLARQGPILTPGSGTWWFALAVSHLPYLGILLFLVGGFIERVGYFARGRAPERSGVLPEELPAVCVQLPMYNEHLVAERVIAAAGRLRWPSDRLEIQVLDDSTDADTRSLVDAAAARVRESGLRCTVLRREDRVGYKAGALEEARKRTDADFLVLFDSDFIPPADYLERALPYFYDATGTALGDVAMVQAQWGHLNADESALTRAQSLWVDDHHTLQMSWRSARWGFVNFTGTAGVWRAGAVERAGGWRAASLVEDCELSFRHLFAGYRTRFVKELVVPAELPGTVTAYKAQQKRWTQGWAQLQRLHLRTLLTGYRTPLARRVHLAYHMLVAVQWAFWAVWMLLLPILIDAQLWLGALGPAAGVAGYLLPSTLWVLLAGVLASAEARHTYSAALDAREFGRRLARLVPYVVLNTGMLAHQACAFVEGLLGPLHSEFERTPKTAASGGAPVSSRRYHVRIPWPYLIAEAFFLAYQAAWGLAFLAQGLVWCGLGALAVAACVGVLFVRWGDHLAPRGLERPRQAALAEQR